PALYCILFHLITCYVHNRFLLSIPTRRSSDLNNSIYVRSLSGRSLNTRFNIRRVAKKIPFFYYVISTTINLHLCTDSSNGCRNKDRKSTRLNSSHVSISYDVFYLKKKNT